MRFQIKSAVRQFARNELICTCLSRCPIKKRFAEVKRERVMDKRGEGVPVILFASDRLSGKRPEYRLLGESELLLTIHSVPIDDRKKLREMVISSGETIKSVSERANELNETIKSIGETIKGNVETTKCCDEMIIWTIKNNPGVSLVALSGMIGKSRASVARRVSDLKRTGEIEYRGSKKTGGYFCVSQKNVCGGQ